MKKYRTWSPEQSFLLPPSPMDWLPEGHLAYFLLDVVGELDLRAIEAAIHAKDARGERPYSPQMMTALLIYAYCTGVFSSRRIERATEEDVAFRVIAGGAHPHWTTINAFRLEHRDALAGLFTQVLTLCRRAGLKTAGHIALDGTKIQANASKHKAMSYERMKADEKRLADEVEALMRRAKDADTRDDAEFGNLRGDELPAELAHRSSRLEKIREAKKALEAEAAKSRAGQLRENAAALRQKLDDRTSTPKEKKTAATLADKVEKAAARLDSGDDDDSDEGGGTSATELPKHRIQTTPAGTPKSSMSRGMALFMIVSLRITTKVATVSTRRISVVWAGVVTGCGAAAVVGMSSMVRQATDSGQMLLTAKGVSLSVRRRRLGACAETSDSCTTSSPRPRVTRCAPPPSSTCAR